MQTVILSSAAARDRAHHLIRHAPDGCVVTVKPPGRSTDQNAKMWAMLSDISLAKPQGRRLIPEDWKAVFMHALGHEVRFAQALDGDGMIPLNYRSSRLTKAQMSMMIEAMHEYGARHGVVWTDGK